MEVTVGRNSTAATGWKSTPLQHSFIRRLLLSYDPKGNCSMCSVVADATALDYAAIILQTLLIEDESAPLEGCMESCDGITACRMRGLGERGHWQCVDALEVVGKSIGEFVDAVQKGFA